MNRRYRRGTRLILEIDIGEADLKSLFLLGSPGRIRTSDQPVNSRLLYR